jgi:hypothetical protein
MTEPELPPEFELQLADLTTHRIEGIARMGGIPFSVPIVSRVVGDLWQGGAPTVLPSYFRHVLSLYPWARYAIPDGVEFRAERLLDSTDVPDPALLEELAAWVNDRRGRGPTLVHCQAGLNRSALVVALALIRDGRSPKHAIELLRAKRSPAVLCNPAFEAWLLELA